MSDFITQKEEDYRALSVVLLKRWWWRSVFATFSEGLDLRRSLQQHWMGRGPVCLPRQS
jgi:hypothetical protein